MKVKFWSVNVEDKNTAYIHFSMTGQKEFDSLIDNIWRIGLKKVTERVSSYTLDGEKLEKYNNQIFIDKKHQITFCTKNGGLKINIGDLILYIDDFDHKSKIKKPKKLSIAITYDMTSPLMCVTPWESLKLIVIKGIKN